MSQWERAFGVDPVGPVPSGAEGWGRAVELGASGRAAAARAAVDTLLRDRQTAASVRAAALATRASLTRQAGGHAAARADDGAAVHAVAAERGRWADSARVDGLIGLAADALGIGDFGASRRLLDRAADALGSAEDSEDWLLVGRPRLRLAWVRTELALYTGDPASGRLATEAVARAVTAPSLRHRVKTDLIAAAATAAGGDVEHAADEADRVAAACRAAGLLPLEWAAQTMLAGLRPGSIGERSPDRLREDLRCLGMGFPTLPGSGVTARYA